MLAIVDPLAYDGALLAYQFNMMVQQQYPIRYGVVPVCTSTSSSSSSSAATSESDKFNDSGNGSNGNSDNDAGIEVDGNGDIIASSKGSTLELSRQASSADVCSLFYVARENHSPATAVDFLTAVAMST